MITIPVAYIKNFSCRVTISFFTEGLPLNLTGVFRNFPDTSPPTPQISNGFSRNVNRSIVIKSVPLEVLMNMKRFDFIDYPTLLNAVHAHFVFYINKASFSVPYE